MSIDFNADLSEMLDADDHGVSITWNSSTFEGILNKEFYLQEGGSVGGATSEPVVYVKSSDVSGIAENDPITVDGAPYTVALPEADGTGLTAIKLNG